MLIQSGTKCRTEKHMIECFLYRVTRNILYLVQWKKRTQKKNKRSDPLTKLHLFLCQKRIHYFTYKILILLTALWWWQAEYSRSKGTNLIPFLRYTVKQPCQNNDHLNILPRRRPGGNCSNIQKQTFLK